MTERETGTLAFFNDEGWGFIKNYDGDDYFLHKSELEGNRKPTKADVIEFDVVETEKGLKAKDAKIIEQPD